LEPDGNNHNCVVLLHMGFGAHTGLVVALVWGTAAGSGWVGHLVEKCGCLGYIEVDRSMKYQTLMWQYRVEALVVDSVEQ
jgi:hypothetical protein